MAVFWPSLAPCQTNPICASRAGGGLLRRVRYPGVQTKPISGRRPCPRFVPSSAAFVRTNKANSQRAGLRRALPGWAGRPILRNKANLPGPTRRRAGCRGRKCRRRSGQARQTKPIPPDRQDGQALCGRRVVTNWTRKGPRRNKANWHGSFQCEVSSLKLEGQTSNLPTSNFTPETSDGPSGGVRTDVPEAQEQACQTKPIGPWLTGRGTGCGGRKGCRRSVQARQTKPIPPERHEGQVPCGKGVTTSWTCKGPRQNKANSGTGVLVQGPTRLPVPPVGPVVQTKPIPARTATAKGRHGCQCRRRRPSCETKPICPAPAGRGIGARGCKGCCRRWGQACETKPIPGVGATGWIWNVSLRAERGNPPPYAGHTRAGRQVQFACSLAWLPVTWRSFELETRLCSQRECSV
jgi:hypothetical protein